jgi:hypothetical protein
VIGIFARGARLGDGINSPDALCPVFIYNKAIRKFSKQLQAGRVRVSHFVLICELAVISGVIWMHEIKSTHVLLRVVDCEFTIFGSKMYFCPSALLFSATLESRQAEIILICLFETCFDAECRALSNCMWTWRLLLSQKTLL